MKLKQVHIIFLLTLSLHLNAQKIDSKFQFHEGTQSYNKGEYDNAHKRFNTAYKLDSTNLDALFNNGNTSYMKKQYINAIDYYKKYLAYTTHKKDKSEGYYNIGNCYLKLWDLEHEKLTKIDNELKNSKVDNDQAIELKMKNFLMTDSLQKEQQKSIEIKDKELNFAINSYKNALRQFPTDDDARFNLSYAMKLLPEKNAAYNEEYNDKKNKSKEKNKGLSSFGQKIKTQILNKIKENEFQAAYSLLNENINKDESLKKELDGLHKKLKTINDILK